MSCGRHLVYILELRRGWRFEPRVWSEKSGLLSSYDRHIGKLNYAWQENTDASGSDRQAKRPFSCGKDILVFLTIFSKSQASSPFEALNSANLSKSQMGVRPSVQKRLKTIAFSRVSTGDSDIPSSCEMKDEPAFKALQGRLAFFSVRASRGPLFLRQKTQSCAHIPISEGRLHLRCLWKAGLPLQSKTWTHSHPQTICGARKFPQPALMKLMILYT